MLHCVIATLTSILHLKQSSFFFFYLFCLRVFAFAVQFAQYPLLADFQRVDLFSLFRSYFTFKILNRAIDNRVFLEKEPKKELCVVHTKHGPYLVLHGDNVKICPTQNMKQCMKVSGFMYFLSIYTSLKGF